MSIYYETGMTMTRKSLNVCAALVAGALGMAGQALAQAVETPSRIRPMTIEMPDLAPLMADVAVKIERASRTIESLKLDMPSMTIEMPTMAFGVGQDREKEAEQRERDREMRAYEQARDYID